MRILLIRPPIIEVYTKYDCIDYKKPLQTFHAYGSQPVGLLRIASHFKRCGHSTRIIDCCAELPKGQPNSVLRWKPWGTIRTGSGSLMERRFRGMPYEEIEVLLKKESADVIMIGTTMTYYCETAHELVKLCKKAHPGVPVIMGGLYATLCPDHALMSGADAVYVGEIRQANNTPTDLSLLPYKPNYAIIKSTRGCPNECTYCVVPKLEGRGMRYRNVSDVVDEIQQKYDSGIRRFMFWESNLLINSKQHFEVILEEIIRRKLKVTLETPEGLAPRFITHELARKMKKAGFRRLFIPLETIDDKYNKQVLKRTAKISEFDNAIAALKSAGFEDKNIKIFVLFGLPGQTYDNVLDSIVKVYEAGCTLCMMPFTPIPGSGEYSKHIKELEGKRIEELHPLLLSMVRDQGMHDSLIRLGGLTNKGLYAGHIERRLKGLPVKTHLINKIRKNLATLNIAIEENLIHNNFKSLFTTSPYALSQIKEGMKVAVIGKDMDGIRLLRNYDKFDPDRRFDAIIDTGELLIMNNTQRRNLLRNVKRSLKRNGSFMTKYLNHKGIHFLGNTAADYVTITKRPLDIEGMRLIGKNVTSFFVCNGQLVPSVIEAVYRKD